MISSALFCDALIGNFQEKIMKKHNASNAEIVLYSYFIGFMYLLFILLINGELRDGTKFCIQVKKKQKKYIISNYTILKHFILFSRIQ